MQGAIVKIQEVLAAANITTVPGNPTLEMWLRGVAGHEYLSLYLVDIAYGQYMQAEFGNGTQAINLQTVSPSLGIMKQAALSLATMSNLRIWEQLYEEQGWPTHAGQRSWRARSRVRSFAGAF